MNMGFEARLDRIEEALFALTLVASPPPNTSAYDIDIAQRKLATYRQGVRNQRQQQEGGG